MFTANAAIVLDGKALCLAAALAAGAADQGGAVVQWRFRDRSVRIAVRLGIQWGQRVTIELDGRPEQAKGNALLVEFGPGRVDFSGVTELVVPSPGMYHLKGSYKSDVASVSGLQWRIVCAGGTNPSERAGRLPEAIRRGGSFAGFRIDFIRQAVVSMGRC